jgi:hypothetical protein
VGAVEPRVRRGEPSAPRKEIALRYSLVLVAALALAAPAAAGDKPDNMVRLSRCPAMGRGVLLVMHYAGGAPGDPNGSGGPWMSPPPPTPLTEQDPLPSIPPEAAPLEVPNFNTDWQLGATADFDGDWTCDLLWSKAGRVALTITGHQGQLPVFRAPADSDPVAELPSDWVPLGAGDFVSADTVAPVGDGHADLMLRHPPTGALSVWAGDGTGRFPADRRYAVQGTLPPGMDLTVIANLDGLGSPELVRLDSESRFMVFHRLVVEAGELYLHRGAALNPPEPLPPGWTLRVSDDLDGDGYDDLVFQHEDSSQAAVWYMTGATRRDGYLFVPERLTPGPPHLYTGLWPIVGPR